jgi:hypothetical protein
MFAATEELDISLQNKPPGTLSNPRNAAEKPPENILTVHERTVGQTRSTRIKDDPNPTPHWPQVPELKSAHILCSLQYLDRHLVLPSSSRLRFSFEIFVFLYLLFTGPYLHNETPAHASNEWQRSFLLAASHFEKHFHRRISGNKMPTQEHVPVVCSTQVATHR